MPTFGQVAQLASDLGTVDMNVVVGVLGRLTPSAAASQTMIGRALAALDAADQTAQPSEANDWQGVPAASTPGEQRKRDTIRAHLNYYNAGGGDLTAGFYDIRDYTKQAFVALNAVADAAAWDGANSFWSYALGELQNLPQNIGLGIGQVVGGVGAGVGQGVLGVLKGLVANPLGIAVMLGAGYIYFHHWKKRRAA